MRSIFLKIKNELRFFRLKYINDLGWQKLISNGIPKSESYKYKVLMATSFGGEPTITSVESLIATSLTLRNATVDVLLCDGLDACQLCYYSRFSSTKSFLKNGLSTRFCDSCFQSGQKIFKYLCSDVLTFSEFLSVTDQNDIKECIKNINENNYENFEFDGLNIGEQALAGARRFYAKADIKDEPNYFEVIKKYTISSMKVARSVSNLLSQRSYDVIVFNHGIYVPQGIITRVAQSRNIRTVNWNTAYRKNCFIFSHGETYHHTLMSETDTWSQLAPQDLISERIVDYIKSRSIGTEDWITFNKSKDIKDSEVYNLLGIDKNKPVIGLLTNVAWDAQLHYPANAFNNMLEWIITTVRYFIQRPDLQLIIRVHPAEITGNLVSRQLVQDELGKVFPIMPDNIKFINSDNNFNTYSAMSICDNILIYGTKMGVELSALGKRVIVAGEAWIRNKGISRDIISQEDYYSVLQNLPLQVGLSPSEIMKARLYAFHFFFRRMIPIDYFKSSGNNYQFTLNIEDLSQLSEGSNLGLDVVCDGILKGDDFIFPAEDYLN